MEHTPLEDFFKDDEPEAELAETPVEPPRDEQGRFAAKETGVEPQEPEPEPVEPSEPPSDKLPPETFKGLREEREKRQNLERELQALREQLQSLQTPQTPPAPPPDIWEDTQAWQQDFGGQVVSTAVQQATLNARLDMSEMMARQNYADFEEVKAEFLAMARENPMLADQARADAHPWNKAYQIAKNVRTMREVGATDLETLKAKLREELMAEAQAQLAAAPATLPPTLTTARNVGTRSGPAWSGPKSLSELLG